MIDGLEFEKVLRRKEKLGVIFLEDHKFSAAAGRYNFDSTVIILCFLPNLSERKRASLTNENLSIPRIQRKLLFQTTTGLPKEIIEYKLKKIRISRETDDFTLQRLSPFKHPYKMNAWSSPP